MASFKYVVTVQEPARPLTAKVGGSWASGMCSPDPEVRKFEGRGGVGRPSELALGHARAQYHRPDGTTVKIERIKVRPRSAGVALAEPTPMPYRRYEVQGGIVRRVDR